MIALFLIGLCWGSFLNVLAFRWIYGHSWVYKRSFCPACKKTLSWYDLIPVISWILLRGRCRACSVHISWLYPFVELLTAASLTLLWILVDHHFFAAYALFFSALMVSIRTDLEKLLIFRAATWYVLPWAFIFIWFDMLPISFFESLAGALFGYGLLWTMRKLFWWYSGKEGLGLGDLDLLALIGGFTGIIGAWLSLVIGSLAGLVAVLFYALRPGATRKSVVQIKIPFGPFLALGVLAYVLAGKPLAQLMLGIRP